MNLKKKLLSILLLTCLIISSVPATTINAAVKLNKTQLSLYIGKSYQLKVTGTKKKVVWKSSKPSVACVSSKGKVTAKKVGTAKITAMVASKTYICKVMVKKKVVTDYVKKITYETYDTSTSKLIGIFHNGNSCSVNFNVSIVFYDSQGKMMHQSSDGVFCCAANSDCVLNFFYPHDSDYKRLNYSTYKITITATPSSAFSICYTDKVKTSSNIGSDNYVLCEALNTSTKSIDNLTLICVYYSGDTIVGYDENIIFDLEAGASKVEEFSPPEDSNYEDIAFDNYKIYINEAYSYKY